MMRRRQPDAAEITISVADRTPAAQAAAPAAMTPASTKAVTMPIYLPRPPAAILAPCAGSSAEHILPNIVPMRLPRFAAAYGQNVTYVPGLHRSNGTGGSMFPPAEYPKRAKGVPAARFSRALKSEVDPAGVDAVKHPAAIWLPL